MPLLKDTAPLLRAEWDLSKNSSLNVHFDTITSTAMKRVWWCCQKDSRHHWRSLVRDRANGRGCPYCFGLQVLPEESFGHLYPALCAEIDTTKNPGFDPYKTTPGAKIQIWWQCSAQSSHSWRSAVRTRTKSDHGCPDCRTASKSLARESPQFTAEWHPEKNLPNTPDTVLASSIYKAWWRCTTNSDHIWQAQVRSRVDGKSKCPLCRNTQAHERLPSLSEFDPELAKQWHPTKNGSLDPSQVTAGTHRKVWWQCTKDSSHEWIAGVRNRARLARGCPFCPTITGRVSRGKSLAEKFPQ